MACFALLLLLFPAYYYLDAGRVLVIYLAIAIGGCLLTLSPAFLWERQEGARGVVRAVVHPRAGRYALAGLGVLALVYLISAQLWIESVVYTLPIAAAAFVAQPRWKVLAVAVVFLAAGFGGSAQAEPLERIAATLNARAPPGASLGTDLNSSLSTWYEPYLRHDLKLLRNTTDADYLVEVHGAPSPPTDRPGYAIVATLDMPHHPAPGTALELKIERALGVEFFPAPGAVYVFEKNATAVPS